MPSLEVNNPYFTAAMEGFVSLEKKHEGGKHFFKKSL